MSKIAENTLLRGLQQGFMLMTPALLIGAFVVAFLNLPIPAFQDFMLNTFGNSWETFLMIIYNGTIQILSLIAVICISYSTAQQNEEITSGRVHVLFPIVTAFVAYVIFQRPAEIENAVITAKAAGTVSMFSAAVIAVVSVKLLLLFYSKFIKYFPERRYSFGGTGPIRIAFYMIIPVFATILIFAGANLLVHYTGLEEGLASYGRDLFSLIFMRDNIFSVIGVVLITQVLWFFGIHGGNVFLEAYQAAQNDAAANGLVISHYSKEFFDVFEQFGGAGSTLALIAVLIIFGSKHLGQRIAINSIIPGLLNINEPLIYGLPIVLNIRMLVPFLLAPISSILIAYAAVAFGIMPLPTHEVAWTMPIFISGYLATGSVSAIFVQLASFAAAFFIYMPFIKNIRNRDAARQIDIYDDLKDEITYLKMQAPENLMSRSDDVGYMARRLGRELSGLLMQDADEGGLHMEFQPKVCKEGKVHGAESLLRWTHEILGAIPPPVTLAIAEDAGKSHELGNWVVRQSFLGMKKWLDAGYKIRMSINLTPSQLNTDDKLYDTIISYAKETGIDLRAVEFELTENATIGVSDTLINTFKKLREVGASFSIDDFGMGHSSLKYLFDFFANVVKLDASLVQQVTQGPDQKLIIETILDLCRKLDVLVICEGVETKEQVDIMSSLGAEYFQGWNFSKALKIDDMIAYIHDHGTTIEGAKHSGG
jgi:lactose/cellobiose-specific phosphotransferase system IIC component